MASVSAGRRSSSPPVRIRTSTMSRASGAAAISSANTHRERSNPMTLTVPATSGTSLASDDLTQRTFMGYRRHNGRVGVRNLVLIIPSVVCSNTVVQRIAQQVPECVFVTHQHGCSQVGDDV